MNKLEKPKFFTTPIWSNIGMVLGIIACFSFAKYMSDIILFLVVVSLIFIFFLWNLIKYIINWNNLYKNYLIFYNKFLELDNRYEKRIQELKNKDAEIEEYEDFINTLNIFILTALTNNSEAETEQLKNLQNLLYLSIEHLKRLKGEGRNGGNL